MLVDFYFKVPGIETSYKAAARVWWIFFALANIVAVVAIWLTKSHYLIADPTYGNGYIAAGRLFGLLGQLAILMELVLIGRITAIEQAFGFDKLNRIHRWIGYSILVLFIGHPLLLTIGYAQSQEAGLLVTFASFLATYKYVFLAFIGTMLFAFVITMSVPVTRKKLNYETWYFTHWLFYIAIGLVFYHEIATGDVARAPYWYYWCGLNYTVFGAVLFYRFIKPLIQAARFQFVVAKIVQETPDVYSVYITGKGLEKFRFNAGQYANITFLARGMWYAHPFSFSAEPNGEYIRFSIKAFGDFTKKIPQLQPGTRVIIDGPLGKFIQKTALREKLLFVAGGIGITPLRALLGELATTGKNMTLLFAARTPADIAFKAELDHLCETCKNITIHYVLSTPTEGYESGYIDKDKIVRIVPDFFDRDVFLCGPPPMMAACVTNLKGLGLGDKHIHYEHFSF